MMMFFFSVLHHTIQMREESHFRPETRLGKCSSGSERGRACRSLVEVMLAESLLRSCLLSLAEVFHAESLLGSCLLSVRRGRAYWVFAKVSTESLLKCLLSLFCHPFPRGWWILSQFPRTTRTLDCYISLPRSLIYRQGWESLQTRTYHVRKTSSHSTLTSCSECNIAGTSSNGTNIYRVFGALENVNAEGAFWKDTILLSSLCSYSERILPMAILQATPEEKIFFYQ